MRKRLWTGVMKTTLAGAALGTLEQGLMGALSAMAAQDSTVQSGNGAVPAG